MILRAVRTCASLSLVLVLFSCASATAPGPIRSDEFPLDPREELAGPFAQGVEEGSRALLAGETERAVRSFAGARKGEHGLAADIGWIEAEVQAGRVAEAVAACKAVLPTGEPTVALLVACGEARARGGSAVEGLDLYQRAVVRSSGRAGIVRRADELRELARVELLRKARASADASKWKEARNEIARAISLAPRSASVRMAAGDIESAAGNSERAFEHYREALQLEPDNRALREKVADLALKSDDYALAVSLFEELARKDPSYRERADEARLAFRVANWPATEREAAQSERLTRAAAARLVWWMFPEVREARVSSSVIASDVVGRRDSRPLARALALGLLEADRETHRASPDAALTLIAASRLCLRLIAILDPSSRELPCFGTTLSPRSGSEAVRIAQTCGLLPEKEASAVTGPELTRALDRIRAVVSRGKETPRE